MLRKEAMTVVNATFGAEAVGQAFVAGSLVEGFGNCLSDVDVFVIAPEGNILVANGHSSESGCRFTSVETDAARFDIEVWPAQKVASLLDRLSSYDARSTKLLLAFLPFEQQFLHHLGEGVPLAGPSSPIVALQSQLDKGRLALGLRHMALDQFDSFVEDAIGAYRSGDDLSAAQARRLACDAVADAYLSAGGCTYGKKSKWRDRFLKDRAGGDSPWWKMYCMEHRIGATALSEGTVGPSFAAGLERLRAAASVLEVWGADASFDGLRFPDVRIRVRRFPECLVIARGARAVECDPTDAAIWLLSGSWSCADIAAFITRCGDPIDTAYVERVVAELKARRLIAKGGGE
jgi:hypothetical protein